MVLVLAVALAVGGGLALRRLASARVRGLVALGVGAVLVAAGVVAALWSPSVVAVTGFDDNGGQARATYGVVHCTSTFDGVLLPFDGAQSTGIRAVTVEQAQVCTRVRHHRRQAGALLALGGLLLVAEGARLLRRRPGSPSSDDVDAMRWGLVSTPR